MSTKVNGHAITSSSEQMIIHSLLSIFVPDVARCPANGMSKTEMDESQRGRGLKRSMTKRVANTNTSRLSPNHRRSQTQSYVLRKTDGFGNPRSEERVDFAKVCVREERSEANG